MVVVIQTLNGGFDFGGQGVRLEMCTADRPGLLAHVTRTFRENGLSISRAEVSTTSDQEAVNVFYVTDAAGHPVDSNTIEAVRQKIGLRILQVKEPPPVFHHKAPSTRDLILFSLYSLVRRNLYNLGLIRSCS